MDIYLPALGALILLAFGQFFPLKDGEGASYRGYTFWGFTFYVVLPIIGIFYTLDQSIKSDTNSKIDKAVAEQRRKDDSVTGLKRWIYDSVEFKKITDSARSIVEKLNQTIDSSSSVLNNLKRVASDEAKFSDQQKFPIKPIDIKIQYQYSLRRDDFNRKIHFLNGLFTGNSYTISNGDTVLEYGNNIDKYVDSESMEYLFNLSFGVYFSRDSNVWEKIHQNMSALKDRIIWNYFREASERLISNCEIRLNHDSVDVKIGRIFKDKDLINSEQSGIFGFKELKGWSFSGVIAMASSNSIVINRIMLWPSNKNGVYLSFPTQKSISNGCSQIQKVEKVKQENYEYRPFYAL